MAELEGRVSSVERQVAATTTEAWPALTLWLAPPIQKPPVPISMVDGSLHTGKYCVTVAWVLGGAWLASSAGVR